MAYVFKFGLLVKSMEIRQSFVIISVFLCRYSVASNFTSNIHDHWQQHLIFDKDGGSKLLMSKLWQVADFTDVGFKFGEISQKCMDRLTNFSTATSKFIGCAVTNSRPLRYCENCVAEYLSVINIYSTISEDSSGAKNNCRQQILRADTIQLPVQTYHFVQDIWGKSTCNRCFDEPIKSGTTASSPSNMTTELLKKINVTLECFKDFSDISEKDPNVNNSVCAKCKTLYRKANAYYEIVEDQDKLCSDLIDSMNYTRLAWANKYHCTGAKRDKGSIWVISAIVGLLPFILYIGIVIHHKRYTRRYAAYDQVNSCEYENES